MSPLPPAPGAAGGPSWALGSARDAGAFPPASPQGAPRPPSDSGAVPGAPTLQRDTAPSEAPGCSWLRSCGHMGGTGPSSGLTAVAPAPSASGSALAGSRNTTCFRAAGALSGSLLCPLRHGSGRRRGDSGPGLATAAPSPAGGPWGMTEPSGSTKGPELRSPFCPKQLTATGVGSSPFSNGPAPAPGPLRAKAWPPAAGSDCWAMAGASARLSVLPWLPGSGPPGSVPQQFLMASAPAPQRELRR